MNEYEIGKNYDITVHGEIAGVKTSVIVNVKCRKITYEFTQISHEHGADWHICYHFYDKDANPTASFEGLKPLAKVFK